ncbi:MAG: acyltransferase [Hymenobacteraceae bacterium]|nr:acyltransferase [Hymenobacteraceae bacterium]
MIRFAPAPLDPFLSQKLRFWSFMAMVLLIYVHGFNLHPRQLAPFTVVEEPASLGNCLQYFLSNGLLRFRIPILFAISGYLFARADGRSPHRARIVRRLRTLGLPFLLWSALWLAAVWAMERVPVLRQAIIDAEISPFWPRQLLSQLTPGEWVNHWLILPLPFQLWFLRNLLVLNLAYPWLRAAVTRGPRIYFPVVALIWFFGIDLFIVGGEGLLFFGLGTWLALRGHDVQAPPAWLRVPITAVLWVGAAAGLTWLAFRGQPAFGENGPQPFAFAMIGLYRLSEVMGILTAWFGFDWLVRRAMALRWFAWLTGFSFFVYVLHVPTVNYATALAFRFGKGIPHLSTYTYLLLPLLIVAGAVTVGAMLRRLAPGAYAVLTGGRGLG